MLDLPNVTLLAVDTRAPALAVEALDRSRRGVHFGDVILVTSRQAHVPQGFAGRVIRIEAFTSPEDYSRFMLKGLHELITTDYVLATQWDGFVLNPSAWKPEFMSFDYVGAPWPHHPMEISVGNGGFSLRSSKLLAALADPLLVPSHPEDRCICHVNRELLQSRFGIRIAPPSLAGDFAFERTSPSDATFGFHGLFNFPDVMTLAELRQMIKRMPSDMFRCRDALDLARRLVDEGTPECRSLARSVLYRRMLFGKLSSTAGDLLVRSFFRPTEQTMQPVNDSTNQG